MPTYKLTYFDLTALAEPTRMLFTYGKIPFSEERIKRLDWPNHKPKMPFGVVPILEVDGKILHQSLAIARYVGNLVKLVGKDAWENAQIDAAADTINDIRLKLGYCFWEADATRKESLKKTLDTETLPFVLPRLDAQAKANNGYLANGKLSWADFFFAGLHDYMNRIGGRDIFAEYPNLEQVYKNVVSIPHIQSYIETSRPNDEAFFI